MMSFYPFRLVHVPSIGCTINPIICLVCDFLDNYTFSSLPLLTKQYGIHAVLIFHANCAAKPSSVVFKFIM